MLSRLASGRKRLPPRLVAHVDGERIGDDETRALANQYNDNLCVQERPTSFMMPTRARLT